MIVSILLLILGLVLILAGANALTDGSSAVARRWGVSDLVIGLTVVAFGTSTPELIISIVSAIEGSAGLAIGNAVGSNIFNILAIIGITALIKPVTVDRSIMANEIPLVILSSVVLLVMANGPLLDGAPQMCITRVDGIILMLFFVIFMRYTFASAKNPCHVEPQPAAAPAEKTAAKVMPMWKSIVWIVGGLAGLIFGGDLFVDSASDIAKRMGVSEAVIGLTIVAAGTSLPELATSIAAAAKGRIGMAVGNVVGSNVFNAFLVLGAAATIRPLPCEGVSNLDLLVLTGASLLFWLFGRIIGHHTITRAEGALMALLYVAYIVALVIRA